MGLLQYWRQITYKRYKRNLTDLSRQQQLTYFSVHPEPKTRYGIVGVSYARNDYAFASVLVLLRLSGLHFHPNRLRIFWGVRYRQLNVVGAAIWVNVGVFLLQPLAVQGSGEAGEAGSAGGCCECPADA